CPGPGAPGFGGQAGRRGRGGADVVLGTHRGLSRTGAGAVARGPGGGRSMEPGTRRPSGTCPEGEDRSAYGRNRPLTGPERDASAVFAQVSVCVFAEMARESAEDGWSAWDEGAASEQRGESVRGPVPRWIATGVVAQAGLLTALAAGVGLGAPAWTAGALYTVAAA